MKPALDFQTEPFEFVRLPERRQRKPRVRGLTMMLDPGLPPLYQEDLLDTVGQYIDLAKFKAGSARLYSEPCLRRKLAAYRERDVKPFIGGQFHEFVFAVYGDGELGKFYAEAKRLGFAAIEISDNIVPLTDKQRADQIRAACDSGLEVFGEVGAKDRNSEASELIDQAGICFDAGASLVLVEAAELVINGKPNHQMLREICAALDMARVMIELPGPWIQEVRSCDVQYLTKLLVTELGPDLNLANVTHDMIMDLEAARSSLGTAGPESALAERAKRVAAVAL
jgi:phosphosulfolactate synthase